MLQATLAFIITLLGGKCKDEEQKENREKRKQNRK
jgi:hypothetical protein